MYVSSGGKKELCDFNDDIDVVIECFHLLIDFSSRVHQFVSHGQKNRESIRESSISSRIRSLSFECPPPGKFIYT